MEFGNTEPILCPICGGTKPQKRGIPPACPCICTECSDNKEYD